jgi:hypothetical protein
LPDARGKSGFQLIVKNHIIFKDQHAGLAQTLRV